MPHVHPLVPNKDFHHFWKLHILSPLGPPPIYLDQTDVFDKPVGDSAMTVKCVLAVKLILPKNEMQTDLRMTLTFEVILQSFLHYVKKQI